MRLLLSMIVMLTTAAGVAVAAVGHYHHPARHGGLQLVAAKSTLGLKGIPVTGLYPGASKKLSVQITNAFPYKIKVSGISAKVAPVTGRAGCVGSAANLVVKPSAKSTIAAKKRRTVTILVTMPRTVANACQGAKFTISLKGKATK